MTSLSSKEHLKEVEHGDNIKEETTTRSADSLRPEDVLCDSCMDNPSRASKSCLTCLVSYCEVHLRPHLENAKFQNHRLVDPLHDIESRTCELHHLPLKRFCLLDSCCVCLECEVQGHEGHAMAIIGEARKQIEVEIQRKEEEISQSASAAKKTIEKLQNNSNLIKSSVQESRVLVEQQFARVQATVTEVMNGAMDVLEGEQRQALRQVDGIQAHLDQRSTELMKTLAHVNKMSRIKSDVDFLQEYSEWKKGVADTGLPSVYINCMDRLTSYVHVLTDATQELCDLILSSYRDKLTMFCECGPKSLKPESESSPSAEPETRGDFLKYARSLTFDPDTTHHFLRITEDKRKLTNTSPWQHSYPEHPGRFEYWRQAMSSQSVYLGRHYIEADLSGEGAYVGVTYKSIDRKGEESNCCITGNDFSWCVGRNSQGFFVWHAGVETPVDVGNVSRIGLYVDFHRGSVSFYDVTDVMTLLHKYQADFIEPLYLAVWLSKNDNVVALVDTK
ncbi:tripartite motif-containing protein 16-like [Solea solea]|uniref:tripartite motif-containing protein 16-like n=1 Tax=Solea solea TaxID=90069 RepID=UPI00272A0A3B|nr:tripartite motif-containing protein 16-like [Solea solea]